MVRFCKMNIIRGILKKERTNITVMSESVNNKITLYSYLSFDKKSGDIYCSAFISNYCKSSIQN